MNHGYVDDFFIEGKNLKIKGWATNNYFDRPLKFKVLINSFQHKIVENSLIYDRLDVQKFLKSPHANLGFKIKAKLSPDMKVNDISSLSVYPIFESSKKSPSLPLLLTLNASSKIKYNKHLIISCIFGKKFQKVYPSIPGRRCIFFSNNPEIEEEVIQKGWEFRFMREENLTSDYHISSMQSKKIKFLQFIEDYPEFSHYNTFTYFDHKFYVKEEHMAKILSISNCGKPILIRKTGIHKETIQDEINVALGQERYKKAMPATIQWLEATKKRDEISEKVRICNTGLIHYKNLPDIDHFLKEVYDTVVSLEQPECQIIWAALSQKNQDKILAVDFKEINPRWEAP